MRAQIVENKHNRQVRKPLPLVRWQPAAIRERRPEPCDSTSNAGP
jgi:hypothetical protein